MPGVAQGCVSRLGGAIPNYKTVLLVLFYLEGFYYLVGGTIRVRRQDEFRRELCFPPGQLLHLVHLFLALVDRLDEGERGLGAGAGIEPEVVRHSARQERRVPGLVKHNVGSLAAQELPGRAVGEARGQIERDPGGDPGLTAVHAVGMRPDQRVVVPRLVPASDHVVEHCMVYDRVGEGDERTPRPAPEN